MPNAFRGDGMNGLKNLRNRRDEALTLVAYDRLAMLPADYLLSGAGL